MTKIMLKFIKIFILGKYSLKPNKTWVPSSAITKQIDNIKKIWHSVSYSDFGIERFFRLFLASMQFLFPGLYIRHVAGKSAVLRKLCLDFYVLFKISIYGFILYHDIKKPFVIVLCSYLILETIVYLFNLLFLRDVYTQPISYKRNLLLTFFNFFEISLGFACIYNCMPYLFNNMYTISDSIYFSFVNATSLGFGDIVPTGFVSKLFSTIQNVISFTYTIVILSYCVSNANQEGFAQKKRRGDGQIKQSSKQKD